MKNVILVAVFLLTAWVSQQVYAQQGFGTHAPDRSAAVDIVSTKRGLLIPRVALTATNQAGPISQPAHSLFVYNTATTSVGTNDVTPGYYYWERDDTSIPANWQGKWVRFISSEDVNKTIVAEGRNVQVEVDNTVANQTTYTVGVKAGVTEGHVLVTALGDHDNDPGTTDQLMTQWTDPAEFVNDVIEVGNGLEKDAADDNRVVLGGALDRATTITTAGANTLAIAGLADVTSTFQDDADGYVMVLTTGGVLQQTKLSSLTQANNGLSIGTAGNEGKVQLGGNLIQPTIITTGVDADGTTPNPANTLAIGGLQTADGANKIVVASDADNVLQTVTRSLSAAMTGDMTVNSTSVPGYNAYVQEVNITAELVNTDWGLTLPDPTTVNGQVINVKIINEDENHTGYLNIFDNTGVNTLTYGALPYQGWVLKSNGSNWLIVGRN